MDALADMERSWTMLEGLRKTLERETFILAAARFVILSAFNSLSGDSSFRVSKLTSVAFEALARRLAFVQFEALLPFGNVVSSHVSRLIERSRTVEWFKYQGSSHVITAHNSQRRSGLICWYIRSTKTIPVA